MKFVRSILFILACSLLISCCPFFLSSAPKTYSINHLHQNVYIDQAFTSAEANYLLYAMNEWSCSTDHFVQFNVVDTFDEKKESEISDKEALLIIKATPETPEIKEMDKGTKPYITLGLTQLFKSKAHINPRIFMVVDRIWYVDEFTAIAEHEYAHTLGLGHLKKKGTLMYWSIDDGSYSITRDDLDFLCSAYNCDASKFRICK